MHRVFSFLLAVLAGAALMLSLWPASARAQHVDPIIVSGSNDELAALNKRVRELMNAGDFEAAYVSARRASEIANGEWSRDILEEPSLNLAEILCYHRGECTEAVALLETVVELRSEEIGPNSVEVAEALLSAAAAMRRAWGENTIEAAQHIAQAKSILGALDLADNPEYLDLIARAERSLPVKADEYTKIEDDVRNGSRPLENVEETYQRAIELYQAGDDYGASRDFALAVAAMRRTEGVPPEQIALALLNFGTVLNRLQRSDRAVAVLEEAETLLVAVKPQNTEALVSAYRQLAAAYFGKGRYDLAQETQGRANELAVALKDRVDTRLDAEVLMQIGELQHSQQLFDDAIQTYGLACQKFEIAGTQKLFDLANCKFRLAAVTAVVDQRLRLLEEAYAIQRELLPPASAGFWDVVNLLGQLHVEQLDYAGAAPFYAERVEIAYASGAQVRDLFVLLYECAAVHMKAGRLDDAAAMVERSRALRTTLAPEEYHNEGDELSERLLASVYALQGRYDEAVGVLEAISDLDDQRRLDASGKPPRSAKKAYDPIPFLTDAEGLSLLVSLYGGGRTQDRDGASDILKKAFRTAQAAVFSGASDAVMLMANRASQGDPERARLLRELQELEAHRDELHDFWADRSRAAEIDKILIERTPEIERTAERIEVVKSILEFKDLEYANRAALSYVNVEEVQAALREDDLLLFYFDSTDGYLPLATYVWAISKDSAEWTRLSVGPAEVQERVANLRSLAGLSGPGRGAVPAQAIATRDDDFFKASTALYSDLLAPAVALGGQKKSLLIVPSNSQAALPFQILVEASHPVGNQAYESADWIINRHSLTQFPSVTAFVHLTRAARQVSPQDLASFVGIGDPDFSGHRRRPETSILDGVHCPETPALGSNASEMAAPSSFNSLFRGGLGDLDTIRSLERLPESAAELCEISRNLGASPDSLLLGASANEANIKAMSASEKLLTARVLQFATHAVVAGEYRHGAEPAIVLTPPNIADEDDDGLLTASEIASLVIDADWVILSACNTSSAQASDMEAFSGLPRAFFHAGARALMVSYWAVDTNAAVELTTRTLANFSTRPSDGKAEALRLAMLSMIAEGGAKARPSYWAPFVILGQ